MLVVEDSGGTLLTLPTQAPGIQSVLNRFQLARRLHPLGLAVLTQETQVPGHAR